MRTSPGGAVARLTTPAVSAVRGAGDRLPCGHVAGRRSCCTSPRRRRDRVLPPVGLRCTFSHSSPITSTEQPLGEPVPAHHGHRERGPSW
jgi:hypothetical protein